jgi:hypothetical protein
MNTRRHFFAGRRKLIETRFTHEHAARLATGGFFISDIVVMFTELGRDPITFWRPAAPGESSKPALGLGKLDQGCAMTGLARRHRSLADSLKDFVATDAGRFRQLVNGERNSRNVRLPLISMRLDRCPMHRDAWISLVKIRPLGFGQ